jgi:3-oxoacyl-[acyl-carrier protein] reductase
MGKLDGKNAVVTGASAGIGRAIALKLAEEGASLALCARNMERLKETAELVEQSGAKARCYAVDVSDAVNVQEVSAEILKDFETIDVLVNNAGVTRDGLIARMSEEDWDVVLDINLKGVFNFCKQFSRPMMKNRGGSIINITSIIGLIGNAGQCNYAASKGGIIAFTKSLARELASRGIRVNAIAPGFIETDMTDALGEKAKESLLDSIPLKRMGSTDDIAEAVLFLAGDSGSYITGQTLAVCGGLAI